MPHVYVIEHLGTPVYVGKTKRLEGFKQRISNHFSDANLVGTDREKPMRCCREMRALLDQGATRDDFRFVLLPQYATEDDAVAHYEAQGYALWNERRGGAGRDDVQWTKAMLALLGTMTDADVAAQTGVSEPTVFRKRQELGIAPFSTQARNVLTDDEAFAVRRRFARNPELTFGGVARELGVAQQVVSRLVRGMTYHHVPRVAAAEPATLDLTALAA